MNKYQILEDKINEKKDYHYDSIDEEVQIAFLNMLNENKLISEDVCNAGINKIKGGNHHG